MRRLFTGMVVAATTAMVPLLAMAGNQEVANEIAQALRDSGQMENYRIGVKFQEGTAWLKGTVESQKQMSTALRLVFQTPGVTRVINNLEITSATESTESPEVTEAPAKLSYPQKTRALFAQSARTPKSPVKRAEALPESFQRTHTQQVAAVEEQPRPVQTKAMMRRQPQAASPRTASRPLPVAYLQQQPCDMPTAQAAGGPVPAYVAGAGGAVAPMRYDQPHMPNYAWPSYAAYPNYAAVTYPRQYSPTAWPYIGPFYPYPQVPLGWRKVTLEWDDGWWHLDFKNTPCWQSCR